MDLKDKQIELQPQEQNDLIDDYVFESFSEEKKEEKIDISGVINDVIYQVITEVYLLSEKTKQIIKKYDLLIDKINLELGNYKEINQRLPSTTPGTAITLNIISTRNHYKYNKLKNLKNKVIETRSLIFEGNTIDEEFYKNYIVELNKIIDDVCSIL